MAFYSYFPCGKLIVTVIRSRGTKGYELGSEWLHIGKADPYVKIKLGGKNLGKEAETAVAYEAKSDPVWNQMFSYFIKQPHDEYNTLHITLMNKNGILRPDNCLGEIRIINLGPYVTGNGNNVSERWYPIFRRGRPQGEILLGFHFIQMTERELLASDSLDAVVGSSSGRHNGVSSGQANYQIQNALGVAQVALGVVGAVTALISL